MITPKNWDSFQHYKNRSPAWIKLHRGLLDDFTFSRLPLASRALAPLLWLIASEYENGEISATREELAFRLRVTIDDLNYALSPLIASGFFIDSEPLAEGKQSACLEEEREEEREENICAVGTPTRTDVKFDEFWKSYPRRDGANPKEPARKLFAAAIKAGENPEAIIAGARRCAMADAKNVGTPYIPQAVKWLRDKRWQDYGDQLGGDTEAPIDWDAIIKLKATIGIWSRHAGPEPGQIGCRAPADVLQKYGLAS
ncbi:MAG: hypothetical protein G4V63_12830 [Candidatus Afipia apatlaquensis]|uniref:DUF1376 domain-containing protein n=1 Tax=Candidatus Afipia apatlaquensis TaxID=2712852 RepID=A0A7C9RFG9_9BRAD|nr:hypothetical protein [Candidatus Afipia apatlaquensis]